MNPSRQAARLLAVALTIQSAINARLLRRPPEAGSTDLTERVSVLLPLRDEADRARRCLEALAAQTGLTDLEFVVLDDDSRDGTVDLVSSVFAGDPRVRLIRGNGDPPPGFLGKPWACARLAEAADPRSGVLVFLDADVVLAPDGLARTAALLRSARVDFISPYPRQEAQSVAERLIQPLLTWSWLTLVPLRFAERSRRPSLAIANGQLLAVDAAAYRTCGGHASPGVRASVLEDIALARALRRHGYRGGMAAGEEVATCRMYDGWPALRDGYAKSLWAAAGGRRSGSFAQLTLLCWLYLRPDRVCYLAGVVSRVIAARRTGGRTLPDALSHPLSVALLAGLTAHSWRARLQGVLRWKGRPVVAAGAPA
ncbi:MAG TPA: glycosyltransferase family 2 protein [Frankiaceae bacterium]|nr:glycosyltransferase family 2 protein [Frankiaceae bacterium]